MKTSDIRIRDPFVFPDPDSQWYYLFGTTDETCWSGPGVGFDCYRSRDLEEWEGPFPAFRPPAGFWATHHFWAPEVHAFNGRYYMFASFKADRRYRGTQVLMADSIAGPYAPLTDGPVTPADWECLDGTLYVDDDGCPWLVFCHEWVQTHNGAICAVRLSDDLRAAPGRPVLLFNASEAPWVRQPAWPEEGAAQRFPTYITDGPFLFRTRAGVLLMLWSSASPNGYAMGAARSTNGSLAGPWVQQEQPIWDEDGGHGMIFHAFDGRLLMAFHRPNTSPNERAVFVEIEDSGDSIRVARR